MSTKKRKKTKNYRKEETFLKTKIKDFFSELPEKTTNEKIRYFFTVLFFAAILFLYFLGIISFIRSK